MKIIVDTHILLWHLTDDPRLNVENSQTIENPLYQKYFSIASLWEIAIKTSTGKLKISEPIDKIIPSDFVILNLEIEHLKQIQILPYHHRDPFDRAIIAQAISENFTVMTDDSNFKLYENLKTI